MTRFVHEQRAREALFPVPTAKIGRAVIDVLHGIVFAIIINEPALIRRILDHRPQMLSDQSFA